MSEEGPGILTTALDHPFPKAWISRLKSSSKFVRPRRLAHGQRDLHESNQNVSVNPELKLPKLASLIIVLLTSGLLQVSIFRWFISERTLIQPTPVQISFFIIVSSSNLYAEHLGGTATFAGLVIGIPTVFSGLTLIPLLRLDQGQCSTRYNEALIQPGVRQVHETSALRMWISFARPYPVRLGVQGQFPVPDSYQSHRVRLRIHVLDVCETILL